MSYAKWSIRESNIFEKWRQRVEKVFCVNRRLPEKVFQSGFSNFGFEEFDWAMSSEFWPSIQKLAQSSGDASLVVGVLEPHPVSYHFQEFGYYNWVEIPSTASPDNYWDVLQHSPENHPADAILINSEVVGWVPTSGAWGIWGERSYGICALGLRNLKISEGQLNRSWRTVQGALQHILPNNFKDQKIPGEFAENFRSNFGGAKDK